MKNVLFSVLTAVFMILVLMFFAKDSKPDESMYKVRRLQEKMTVFTKISPQEKVEYYLSLLDKRFMEMQYVYDKKLDYFAVSTSLRYSATAGEIVEIIKKNNLSAMIPEVRENFENHKTGIKNILDSYPYTNEKWKFFQDALNYLDLYLGQLE